MKVVNLRKEKYTHYIGRGSIFGNSFVLGNDGTREEVINKYEKNIRELLYSSSSNHLIKEIYELPKDAILGCYCKPKNCHGDVIVKIWKELHNENC